MMRTGLLLAFLVACAGCQFERHYSVVPEQDQVLRAESGDRFIFDLEENMTTGYSWRATCDDSDVDVSIRHRGPSGSPRAGAPGKAEVEIRMHRGYDGPTTVVFTYKRDWEKEPIKKFTITFYKRTIDRAFWE